MPQTISRDALVERLVTAGELLVQGAPRDEIAAYFDTDRFQFFGPDNAQSDFDGLNAYFAAVREAFDDRTIRRRLIVAEGSLVACQTTIEGVFARVFSLSPVGVLPPNGQRVTWDLITIFRFDDAGRLLEEHVRLDNRSVLRQLGVAEASRP